VSRHRVSFRRYLGICVQAFPVINLPPSIGTSQLKSVSKG